MDGNRMTRRQTDRADAQRAACAQAAEDRVRVADAKKAVADRKKAEKWIKDLTPAQRLEVAAMEYKFSDEEKRAERGFQASLCETYLIPDESALRRYSCVVTFCSLPTKLAITCQYSALTMVLLRVLCMMINV